MSSLKSEKDLEFIKNFQDYCKSINFRMVVYGGYGLDAYFHKLSRPHGDIDLVVFGKENHVHATKLISTFIKSLYSAASIKQNENPFQIELDVNDTGFGLDLYYVQTSNDPFINIHTIIKSSGETVTNDPMIFPPPEKGSLEGLELEVQDQSSHLKDILVKGGASESKYIGDLKLLSPLFSRT